MNFVDSGCEALVRVFLKRTGRKPGRTSSTRSDPSFRRTGDSFDLKSIREYGPGDDVRHIDWKLYGRSGRLYIKEFFGDLREGLCILVDLSSSIFVFDSGSGTEKIRGKGQYGGAEAERGDGTDGNCSLRVAASLAWIFASLGVPIDLMAFSDRITALMPPSHGSPSSVRISGFLAGLERGGRTELTRALREAKTRSSSRRVLVISDFLDPSFTPSLCPFARLFAIRLHRDLEVLTEGLSEAEIRDPETGTGIRLGVDATMWNAYHARDAALDVALKSAWSRKLGPEDRRIPLYRDLVEAILD